MTSSSQTYRLQNPARAAWLVMVMLGWFSCGPHGTPILITLAGDLTDVESIELTPVLNGHPGQVITHDPAEKQRVLWIPESESGQLQIEADGKSRGADDCKPAHASASVAFRPDFSKPTEVELNFKPAQCLLTVQLHGVASVTSQPEGLDCPVGATVCKGWFARGQAVNLNAGSRSSSRYGNWTGACQAQGANCNVIIKTTSTVVVHNRRGICSQDDWCLQQALPMNSALAGVAGIDTDNIWVVGDEGTILKWNGVAWFSQPSGTVNDLTGVWGSSSKDVWAVAHLGTILHWDGTAWSPQNSRTSTQLEGVWGSDANNVWAVGRDGTILHWDGTAWSQQESHTTEDLYRLWGSGANNVWAVGDAGTILKWNGTIWSPQQSGTLDSLMGVWGSDANHVWAVGGRGAILQWDGTVWSPQQSGTSQGLWSAWGTNESTVWAVGDEGTIV